MKDYFKASVEKLRKEFSEKRNISIFVHTNPDGDAMGAALGLRAYFKKAGHTVSVISPGVFADFFLWMPGSDTVLIFDGNREEVKEIIKNSDLLFGVDFNDFSRLNGLEHFVAKQDKTKIIIDHHPFPRAKVDFLFDCTEVSSASELVYEFMREVKLASIDKEIASCIYTGILTDTGNFSHNDSHPRTFEVIAELMSYDINKEEIRRNLFQNFTYDRLRLQGLALHDRLVYLPEHKTAYIYLSQKDLEAYNFKLGDTEGFVNMPLAIKDVNFSVLFIEKEKFVKLSLRSKGDFDVNEFARKYFDGGGHRNAAGGRSFKNMEETLRYFESLLPENIKTTRT